MVGEETHIFRDVAKLNGKEGPFWTDGRPRVGRREGHEDLAYTHQALPQPPFSAYDPREQRQIYNIEEQSRGPDRSL